jgi:hypothetical protein
MTISSDSKEKKKQKHEVKIDNNHDKKYLEDLIDIEKISIKLTKKIEKVYSDCLKDSKNVCIEEISKQVMQDEELRKHRENVFKACINLIDLLRNEKTNLFIAQDKEEVLNKLEILKVLIEEFKLE